MKHVVIAGGGFAGVHLARKLKSQKNISVTLINNSVDFRYCPALYRAATGAKIGSARLPLEWMLLDSPHADLLIDTVTKIDPGKKQISTAGGAIIDYDYAVMALGSVTTYFNIEGLHEHSYGIKTPDEVVRLRQHLHNKISQQADSTENIVIVGAGPTGVELAGGLGHYVRRIAKKHRVKKHRVKIWLVEAGPRILPQLSVGAARAVQKRLTKIGVKILTDTAVTKETINSLNTSDGTIKTHTVVWTAGTANNPFFQQQQEGIFIINPKGKVVVNKHLQSADDVYVIGDNAATLHSGLALTAVSHANFVAKDIKAQSKKRHRPNNFEHSPAQIVPIGNRWAVFQYKKLVLHGRIVSIIRKIADYVGYSDVLGILKALTIWANSENTEYACSVCIKSKK